MYYQTPNIEKYVSFILKNRIFVIVGFALITFFTLLTYQPKMLTSDAMFWLKDSEEFQKTDKQNYETFFLSKLTVKVDEFNDSSLAKLQKIQQKVSSLDNVKSVSSLFSKNVVKKESGEECSMVGVVNVGSLDSYKIKALVNELSHPYAKLVDKKFQTFNFYITSTSAIDIKSLNLQQTYNYKAVNFHINWYEYILYISILTIVLVIVFRVLFSNYISSFSAIIVVSLTSFLTFAIIYFLTGIKDIYIAMPLISVSIALVDYLFFYYRWHVSQYKTDTKNALVKMLNRNLTPALWTSVLTTLGLGSLVFVNSDVIKLLSLSVIISSIVGYLVNLTFLPSFLSFFKIKHAHVKYAKLCYSFASNELHYNKKYLVSFLVATFLLLLLGIYKVYDRTNDFFQLHVKNDQVMIVVPYEQIDLKFVNSLQKFSDDITDAFADSIDEITSLSNILHELNSANSQTDSLDTQALQQALFYLDMYGLSQKYYDENSVKITIDIFDIDKNRLIQWLRNYKDIDIYFVDKSSLLNSAMYEKTLLLSVSLFSALLIIGVITAWIFKTLSMAFVGFIVNAIPIVWFGLIVKLLNVPLSLEMLIAMTISVGLASDATIHFAFKYFRGRYYQRSKKHSLEKMFFYSGIPVIFGSIILISLFALLGLSGISSLQDIGLYSSLLIALSLFTDLFVLPVILLFVDKFGVVKVKK